MGSTLQGPDPSTCTVPGHGETLTDKLSLSVPAMLLAFAVLLSPCPARGGGFDVTVLGARGIGRAGAITASVDDLSALEHNPAALARIRGTRSLLAVSPILSQMKYRRAPIYDWSRATSSKPPPAVHYEEIENELRVFPMAGALFGVGSDLGISDWVFAVGVHGPNAVGHTRYPEDGPQRYQMIERDILLASYSLAAAWSRYDWLGIGLSLHWIDVARNRLVMVVDADSVTSGVYPDASPYDLEVTLDTADRASFSATLGAWLRPIPCIEIAVAGRVLPTPIETEGKIELQGRGDLLHGKHFSTWSAQGQEMVPDDRARLSFDYPTTARAGLRYLHRDGDRLLFDLELDLIWEGWSTMEGYRIDLPTMAKVDELGMEVPLQGIALDRNWQDVWGVRLGGELNLIDRVLWLRGGAFYETGAVPHDYSYLDFLSFDRLGLGMGLSVAYSGVRVDLAYLHVFNEPRAVSEAEGKMYQQRPASPCRAPYTGKACDPHYQGQPGAVGNAGTYLSGYDVFGLGLELNWSELLGDG